MTRIALFLLCCLTLACEPRPRAQAGTAAWRGMLVTPPRPTPDFTLTSMHGRPFTFGDEADGYLTLLFFGYTNCPDVCPVHMANLAAVIRDLAPSQQARIKVVFVTTDPARDTPERLRSWLANFHRDFIGLTGDLDSINVIQRSIGVPAAVPGPADGAGSYDVGHGASVLAFTPDGLGRLMYPFGTRQADWARDLPRLLDAEWDS